MTEALNSIRFYAKSKERNEQDRLRYETKEGEHYWNEKPNHSMRHVFAQLWLEKSY